MPPSYDEVVDIGTYLLDTTETIRALIMVYPPAAHAFASCLPFIQRLQHVYEYHNSFPSAQFRFDKKRYVLPILENTILAPSGTEKREFVQGIEIVKRNILEILHCCWDHCFFEYFFTKSQGKNSPCETCRGVDPSATAEEMLTVFTQILSQV